MLTQVCLISGLDSGRRKRFAFLSIVQGHVLNYLLFSAVDGLLHP